MQVMLIKMVIISKLGSSLFCFHLVFFSLIYLNEKIKYSFNENRPFEGRANSLIFKFGKKRKSQMYSKIMFVVSLMFSKG
jgi:hypothetical protein